MNIAVCLWSQDCIICTLQLSTHNSHKLFDTVTKYGVSHKWIFQVTVTYLLEPVNMFYLNYFIWRYFKNTLNVSLPVEQRLPVMILSLYFAWQFRVNTMNIRSPCRVIIQKRSPIRVKRAIQNGLRLLKCLFICSSWICLFSFLCLPHPDMIIFATLAHSNGFALSDILFLIYYELKNYTPRLVKVVYTERIY